MNIPISLASFVLGCILIIVAIVGGGLEARDVKIPRMSLISRALAALFGGALMAMPFAGSSALAALQPSTAPSRAADRPAAPAAPDKVEITVTDQIGEQQAWEQAVVVMADGSHGVLTVDDDKQQSDALTLRVPRGQVSYEVYTAAVAKADGAWSGVAGEHGAGELDASPGARFQVWGENVGGTHMPTLKAGG